MDGKLDLNPSYLEDHDMCVCIIGVLSPVSFSLRCSIFKLIE